MPSGLEIIGDHGAMLISADAIHPGFYGKQQVTIRARAEGEPQDEAMSSISLDFGDVPNPIYAISGAGQITLAHSKDRAWAVVCYANPEPGQTMGRATIYCFGRTKDDGPRVGLRMYTEGGVCGFNSNYKPVLVVRSVGPTETVDMKPPRGRSYAFIPNDYMQSVKDDGGTSKKSIAPVGHFMDGEIIKYMDGSERYRNEDNTQSGAGFSRAPRNLIGGGVVIDVTGY